MSIRYERMNEEIKKTISENIKDMKDPRVSDMTTIMSVDVTNDLKQAKVLVSVYDKDDEVRRGTVEALNLPEGGACFMIAIPSIPADISEKKVTRK